MCERERERKRKERGERERLFIGQFEVEQSRLCLNQVIILGQSSVAPGILIG
jgi:hypothetical protein